MEDNEPNVIEEEIRGLQTSVFKQEEFERKAKESGLREKYLVKESSALTCEALIAVKKIEKELINR